MSDSFGIWLIVGMLLGGAVVRVLVMWSHDVTERKRWRL